MDIEISYFDFKNLPEQDQCKLVMAQGQLVSESADRDLRFVVYKLGFFLVEMTYIQQNNKLAGFNVYQNNYHHTLTA